MSTPQLSEKEARQWILSAQGLLVPYNTANDAMQALFAVQSQYPGNLLAALFARSRGVTHKKLETLLQKERTIYKTWSLRHTLHAHLANDRHLLHSAIGKPFYDRFQKQCLKANWFTEESYDECQEAVLKLLQNGPLLRSEIHDQVPFLQSVEYAGWGMDVKGLAYEGKVVFAEQGAARTKFVSSAFWFGSDSVPQGTLTDVLRRYLLGHGLATQTDFRYWTLRDAKTVSRAFEELEPELDKVEIKGRSLPYYKLKDATVHNSSPKVKLLAKFDPLVLGWKDKSLYLDAKFQNRVVMPAAQIEATVLYKGKIVATWRQSKGKRDSIVISIFPFQTLTNQAKSQIHNEAARLAKAQGSKLAEVTFNEV